MFYIVPFLIILSWITQYLMALLYNPLNWIPNWDISYLLRPRLDAIERNLLAVFVAGFRKP